MDVEDTDDYLFYLEDILKTIHKVGAAVRACSRSCVNPADDDTQVLIICNYWGKQPVEFQGRIRVLTKIRFIKMDFSWIADSWNFSRLRILTISSPYIGHF